MNKYLKKILIVAVAVSCVIGIQLSVNASLADQAPWINDLINNFFSTTAQDPNNTTTTKETTTSSTGESTTADPVNNTGTGSLTTTTETTTYQYNPTYYYPSNGGYDLPTSVTTTEPSGDENNSLSFEASLSDLFEDDSAAVIVQPVTEPFTIGGLIVNNGNENNDFTWQKAALVAVAVLFVVLIALIVALIIQRSKKSKDDEYVGVQLNNSESSGPVPVEVMSAERIAELLGTAAGKNVASGFSGMTSEESAAAIKTAALMGQLDSYSDPLIRKYTDEPVMISPSAAAALDLENATGADVLKATESMLDAIAEGEKYALDVSGYDVSDFDIENDSKSTVMRVCPDCGNSVPSDDVFCHNCGTYIG